MSPDADMPNYVRFIGGIPVMSLFVVFDLVLSYPNHRETNSNLALLDVAGGHFGRIEYASGGWLPGSLITEFSGIAREYINSCRCNDGPAVPSNIPQTDEITPAVQPDVIQTAPDGEIPHSSGSILEPVLDLVEVSQATQHGVHVVAVMHTS